MHIDELKFDMDVLITKDRTGSGWSGYESWPFLIR